MHNWMKNTHAQMQRNKWLQFFSLFLNEHYLHLCSSYASKNFIENHPEWAQFERTQSRMETLPNGTIPNIHNP